MSIDLTNGLVFDRTPQHYIVFGDFDSRRAGLHLHERSAPTPEEKENKQSLPYMQGVVDMSNALGNRIYENREITYTFYQPYIREADANACQTTIENQLMQGFDQVLQDSYDTDYRYKGKCSGVVTTDDYAYKRLIVDITFDLYPFKICNYPEGSDDWDSFNFELDVFQDVTFKVVGNVNSDMDISLLNVSQSTQSPTIIVSYDDVPPLYNHFHITQGNTQCNFAAGTYNNTRLRLKPGENNFKLNFDMPPAIATVTFQWNKELI